MKTVYIVTYRQWSNVDALCAFSSRADAEEYILALYTEVECAMFNALLMDMSIDEAMSQLKFYIHHSNYTIEECIYID